MVVCKDITKYVSPSVTNASLKERELMLERVFANDKEDIQYVRPYIEGYNEWGLEINAHKTKY